MRRQYLQKFKVWAGIIGEQINGPILINDNLKAEKYLSMITAKVGPVLRNLYSNAIDPTNVNVWFMHDWTKPDGALMIRTYLNEIQPDRHTLRDWNLNWHCGPQRQNNRDNLNDKKIIFHPKL